MGNSQGFGKNTKAIQVAEGHDLTGKLAIVTGGNSGVGKETARVLVMMGATVIIGCRSSEKGKEAVLDIVESTQVEDKLFFLPLDLASFESVRTFVQLFQEQFDDAEVNYLVNNAGVMATPEWKTEDGLEYQIGINHFGHFLLTNLLLENLKRGAPSRIINVSSVAHSGGKIDFENINLEGKYDSLKAYSQSKLANILFTLELKDRLSEFDISCYSLHPGFVTTNLAKDSKFNFLFKVGAGIIGKNVEQGAATSIYAITSETLTETDLYLSDCQVTTPSEKAQDKESAERLWNLSLEICDLQNEEL